MEIGNRSNAQNNVVVRAREDNVAVGEESSLSHHAVVRDSEIGDSVFVGYNTEVRNSRVGDGAFVYPTAPSSTGWRSPRTVSWDLERR